MYTRWARGLEPQRTALCFNLESAATALKPCVRALIQPSSRISVTLTGCMQLWVDSRSVQSGMEADKLGAGEVEVEPLMRGHWRSRGVVGRKGGERAVGRAPGPGDENEDREVAQGGAGPVSVSVATDKDGDKPEQETQGDAGVMNRLTRYGSRCYLFVVSRYCGVANLSQFLGSSASHWCSMLSSGLDVLTRYANGGEACKKGYEPYGCCVGLGCDGAPRAEALARTAHALTVASSRFYPMAGTIEIGCRKFCQLHPPGVSRYDGQAPPYINSGTRRPAPGTRPPGEYSRYPASGTVTHVSKTLLCPARFVNPISMVSNQA
ncbi:hypothetical protein BD779DRAFT_1475813 [Infundibulicybe gibba]|nr:hypothetical protein BD779DRAFT_1475813 [Infundibulicybe gibba]